MKPKVLLTGRPGCGKTTLIKRVVNELALSAGGFYTEEIRQGGQRVGFKIITLDGEETVLAHVDFNTKQRVGKYGIDLRALEPMEIRSRIFCDIVTEALDSGKPILGTITARSFPFTNRIKKRHDVTLIAVRPNNREQLVSGICDQFMT